MMRVVLLTSSELRHAFFRKAMALEAGVEVLRTYCEEASNTMAGFVAERGATGLEATHFAARVASEADFFQSFVRLAPDCSNPKTVARGAINESAAVDEIRALNPDLLISYGCSIVRESLLAAFPGRFVNIHLGLSPYYRGGATNFWPLVNGEPEYVGATFMYIDAGIDTGEIIHQIRARVLPGDGPHQIGNRLITDMVPVAAALARNFSRLERMPQPPVPETARHYKRKDMTPKATEDLYRQFANGLVDAYLAQADLRAQRAPIVENPALPA